MFNGLFALDGGDLVVARELDFETSPSYSISEKAGGLSVDQTLSIMINDVVEKTFGQPEAAANGTAPTDLSAIRGFDVEFIHVNQEIGRWATVGSGLFRVS